MSLKKLPTLAILMCTYNGEEFLEEQLDSIEGQDYKNWTLYVNDDGSKDRTLSILKAYQKNGAPKNFISAAAPKKVSARTSSRSLTIKKLTPTSIF
jgi:glycosyltransferase involved in cell wall biosynthesis